MKNKNYKGKKMLEKAQSLNTSWAYNKKGLISNESLILLDNVQFIYELALAQLELKSLGVEFEITNSMREIKVLNDPDRNLLIKKLAYFKMIDGKYTDYFKIIQKNVTRSVNQYLTHWIYPYKGKFHPQMIRALINIIGLKNGNTIFDPFIGSGTTAVEAKLLGINCIGIDVSPLCVMQTKVKTKTVEVIDDILKLKDEFKNGIGLNLFNNGKRTFIEKIKSVKNDDVKNFFRMAYLIAVSDQERRNRKLEASFVKNLNLMINSIKNFKEVAGELNLVLSDVDIRQGDCRQIFLDDESVDGIITSPPYSIALDYVTNDAHALKVLGYELSKVREYFIGVRGKGKERIDLYNEDMRQSYKEMYRVLKKDKFAAIIIGNATYLGKEIKTVEFTIDYCSKLGFKLIKNVDKIIFGLYNIMLKENILIFKKQSKII